MLLMLLFACGGCDPKPPADGSPTALAAASRQAEEPAASASASPPVTSVAVGDVFGGEKLDAAWASETASKLEKSIAAHLDADQRALLGGIECRSVSCAIEVNDQQPERTKQLWKVLRKRVAPDIGTALYEFALEQMKHAGMKVAMVGTGGDPSHAPARRAYRKVGFDVELPTVWMYKALSSTRARTRGVALLVRVRFTRSSITTQRIGCSSGEPWKGWRSQERLAQRPRVATRALWGAANSPRFREHAALRVAAGREGSAREA